MKILIDNLRAHRTLKADEYHRLLACEDEQVAAYLHKTAREVTQTSFGNKIFIRALIEITNCCQNDCFYCGIRKSNTAVKRYYLDKESILSSCKAGYDLGFRTFVMQGGENAGLDDVTIEKIVTEIRQLYPDCAITLSLGEKPYEVYERFYQAGANRYLLRHETHNKEHYERLHPRDMSIENRLRCLIDLKKIGFQTGTGVMVGSPFQTLEHLIEDIQFIESFSPEMIGIGPYIPHHATPFASFASGSIELTLRLISILRLIHPSALIPSTTALNTMDSKGREKGILAGANVVMPNLTPSGNRKDYKLYDNKFIQDAETAEGLKALASELDAIGYEISYERGDYI